jgi:O-antigen ligase
VNSWILKNSTLNLYLAFFIPPLLTNIVSGATMDDFDKESLTEYLIYIVPVLTIYTNFIIGIYKGRKRIKLDFVLLGLIIYFVTMIPSIILTINPYNTYLMIGLYVNAVLLFFYFLSQDINKEHFFIMMIAFAIQSSIQMIYVLYQGDIADMVLHKQITIGWSVSNNIGQYMVFALPFVTYFSTKYKKISFLFHYLSIFLIISLLMTGARASFAGFIIILPFLIYLMIKNFSVKHDLRDLLLISVPTFLTLYKLNQDEVLSAIWERLISKALDSSSRIDIWKNSLKHFIDYQWFGSGLLTTSDFEYPLTSYHNIFIDALTNTGILGFVGLAALLLSIFIQLRHTKSTYNFVLGLSMITFFINSLLDTVHYNPITLMIILVSFAYIDRSNKTVFKKQRQV